MRIHRALGVARRARRVDHERNVVARQFDGSRPLAGVPCNGLEHVRRIGVPIPPHAGKHRRQRLARLQEVERRRRDRVPHGRRRQRRPRDVGIKIFLANHRQAAGAPQDLAELALAQHRIARHDDGAALPDREHRDDDLRNVLQVHGHPVAGFDAALLQPYSQRVGHRIAFGGGDRALEVVHERRAAVALERSAEHVERGLASRLQLWADTAIKAEPRTLR